MCFSKVIPNNKKINNLKVKMHFAQVICLVMKLFVSLSHNDAKALLHLLYCISSGQRAEDKKEDYFSSYTFLFPLSCLLSEPLLHSLLPFTHMNVEMLKVNDKLIVSEDAPMHGSQSCGSTTK